MRVPNPEEKDAFDLAVAMQKKLGADLCVGTDPDCDRVGVACLTASGDVRLLTGNQIGCILLHYILSQKKALGTLPKNAAAVKSIVSTEMARAICLKYDTELFDVLTGFKFIAEKIQQFEETGSNTFEFGFEESYGFLSGTDVRDKDGVNAVMLIAEAACYYKKMDMTLVDAIEELYKEFGTFGERTVSIVLPGKDGLEKMQTIMQTLRDEGVEKVGPSRVMSTRDYMMSEPKSDVLYYTLEQGWACVRPSGNRAEDQDLRRRGHGQPRRDGQAARRIHRQPAQADGRELRNTQQVCHTRARRKGRARRWPFGVSAPMAKFNAGFFCVGCLLQRRNVLELRWRCCA